jgi:hypothetical protein
MLHRVNASAGSTVRDGMLVDENWDYAVPTVEDSPTLSRNENYYQPLVMDLSKLLTHIEHVGKYVFLTEPVDFLNRLFAQRTRTVHEVDEEGNETERTIVGFRDALDSVDPHLLKDLFLPWLVRAAHQQVEKRTGNTFLDAGFWRFLRTSQGQLKMCGNIVNATQQVTGYSLARALGVTGAYLGKARMINMTDSTALDSIFELSVFMRTFAMTAQIEVENAAKRMMGGESAYVRGMAWIRDNAYFMQVMTQGMVNRDVWLAAYMQAKDQGMEQEAAVAQADSVVTRSQGGFRPEMLADFEAGPAMIRAIFMFCNYYNTKLNLLRSEAIKGLREGGVPQGLERLAVVGFWGHIVPALTGGWISRGMSSMGLGGLAAGDDDDEKVIKGELVAMGSDLFRETAALVPGGAPVINAWNPFDTFTGFHGHEMPSVSPAIGAFKDVRDIFSTSFPELYKLLDRGRNKDFDGRDIHRIIETSGFLLRFPPAGPAARAARYVRDVQVRKKRPEREDQYIRGVLSGR